MKTMRRHFFVVGGCGLVAGFVYAVMEIGRLNARIENDELSLRALRDQVDAQAVKLEAVLKIRAAQAGTGPVVQTPDGYVVKRDPKRVRSPGEVDTPPRGYYEQINFMREAVRRTLPATGK